MCGQNRIYKMSCQRRGGARVKYVFHVVSFSSASCSWGSSLTAATISSGVLGLGGLASEQVFFPSGVPLERLAFHFGAMLLLRVAGAKR